MSEVKVNKISPRTNCGTVQLGDSGDTITIPAGATIVNNGTQTGFGRTGTVDWDTTAKTASFTAVSGNGYFVNTTSGARTITLPATPSAGDIVAVADYAGTAATNNITIARNSSNINGAASDLTISKNNSAITLVYVDGTQGWKGTDTSNLSDIELEPAYITATGGTVTCCGDYKIHTFTGPGTFTVCSAGNSQGSNTVDYLVVAGGGSGGAGGCGAGGGGGGGGAGGYRESSGAASGCYSISPLGACVSALPVSASPYPITVGGGGTGVTSADTPGNSGSNSVFSTITSAAGGGGGGGRAGISSCTYRPGLNGGSGGGAGAGSCTASPSLAPGGTGNTPPVSPPQGSNGGSVGPGAVANRNAGSGGGATAVGSSFDCGISTNPGPGGAGGTSSITGSPVARAGGGGGGAGAGPDSAPPVDGGGKGGYSNCFPATAGTANTGGGGGGGGDNVSPVIDGAAGGSGIVIIRYKYQ